MTDIEKITYNQILLKTLSAFDVLCKENNLKYCLAYGSLIGAVRHKGLIPWDDDLDVFMPIDDYRRLLSLKDNLSIPYRILDIHDKGYFKPFAKFCDANTTIWEDPDIPCIFGVYIDVFPLYEGSVDDYKKLYPLFYKYSWKYEMGVRRIFFSQFYHALFHQSIRSFLGRCRYLFDYKLMRNYYKKKFFQIESLCRQCKGDYYISYCGYAGKNIYPKKCFQSFTEVPFENLYAMIPCGFDEILTKTYGDYMTPPSTEQRQNGGHPKYFMDLTQYLSYDTVRTLV